MSSSRASWSRAIVAAWALLVTAACGVTTDAPSGGFHRGSLVAAFVTSSEILLMSDGRAVSSVDGAVAREDLSKVHHLAGRTGLLTAGRVLPGFVARARSGAASGAASVLSQVSAVKSALADEWAAATGGASGVEQGRAFVFVAGFDPDGTPRIFHMDTRKAPDISVSEITVLGDGRELDLVAMSSSQYAATDASEVIVRHVSALHGANAGLSRRALLVAAFKAAQADLAAYDARIGGRTFAAVIDRADGYEAIEVK